MENYSHLVVIDPEKRVLKIYRVFDDSRQEFLTERSIDGISAQDDWDQFASFAQQLGENLLIDSPAARQLMDL